MKKLFGIFAVIISFFTIFFFIIQKGYADNSVVRKNSKCKLTKSTWYPYNSVEWTTEYSTYHYTDSGEMAKYTTPERNSLDSAKIKTKDALKKTFLFLWASPYSLSPKIVLYDTYGEEIAQYFCREKEDYDTCHKRYPLLIETFHDENNNSVTEYSEANSGKILTVYVFNPKGQKTEEEHYRYTYNINDGVQYRFGYNSDGLVITEDVINFSDEKNYKYIQSKYRKYYKYDKNNNVIRKDIECKECEEKFKNEKFYQEYKYDSKNNLIAEDGYLPSELDGGKISSYPSEYGVKYEYDSNGNLIKKTNYMAGFGAGNSYSDTYKYDKYGNITAKYSCEKNNDKKCKLYEKLEYECK